MCLLLLEGLPLPSFFIFLHIFHLSSTFSESGYTRLFDQNLSHARNLIQSSKFKLREMSSMQLKVNLANMRQFLKFEFHTNFHDLVLHRFWNMHSCISVLQHYVALNTINSAKRSRAGSRVNQTKQPCTFIQHFLGQSFSLALFF